MISLNESELYRRVGEEGFARLVGAFYRRIRDDDLIGPMYPADDWEGSERRLREFLLFRFGGDERYLAARGHPRLRMRHFPFAITPAARDRWMQHMDAALAETGLDAEATATLRTFFAQVAEHMRNRE